MRLDAEGYRRLALALEAAEKTGAAWQNVLAIRAITLTGCRRGEITGLRKNEIDIAGQTLRLADTKTGESIRPVGKAAMDVIRAALERSGKSEFVFPARNGNRSFAGLPKGWTRIIGAVLPGITAHALRHSFASISDDLGYSEATIGAMLGHSGRGTTRKYIHKLDPALVAAADRVAERIAEMMNGTARTAEIVPLQKSA
jgi:integrase